MKKFLHVGCGMNTKEQTTLEFKKWNEIRYDIDENVKPDIIGSMTNMNLIKDQQVDAIFSSHNIEHLYPHEVSAAFREFNRVLNTDGFVVLTCPDLQSVCSLVASDMLTEPAYVSPAGPIAPMDILFGHRASLERGNTYMAHRCGFTQKVLIKELESGGFIRTISIKRSFPFYDLWVVAFKKNISDLEMIDVAKSHFPKQS